MDRLLASRTAAGRLDRSLASGLPLRAGIRRGSRRTARPLRWPRSPLPGLLTGRAAPLTRALCAFWRRRRRLRIAVLVLVPLTVLLSGGWLWLRHSSLAAVRNVRITGLHGPQAGAIEAALDSAAHRMSTLDVRLAPLRAAVAPFAVVREVRARASFPHGLQIRVIEQAPVAALAAAGARTAVAADGVVLGPALLSGSLPTVSAASAPPPGRRVAEGSLQETLAVLGAVPGPLQRFVQRAYSGAQGIEVVMRGGLTALFGDSSRPHAKWIALSMVLANERASGASYVDVRVPERPAAGFAPGTAPPASSSGSASAAGQSTGSPESIAAALTAGLSSAVEREGGAGAPSAASGSGEEEGSASQQGQHESASGESGEQGAGSETGGSPRQGG
jgi:cell division protein FtsQ